MRLGETTHAPLTSWKETKHQPTRSRPYTPSNTEWKWLRAAAKSLPISSPKASWPGMEMADASMSSITMPSHMVRPVPSESMMYHGVGCFSSRRNSRTKLSSPRASVDSGRS